MSEKMERFKAASSGMATDRPPVGCWVHFGSALWDPDITADVHLRFFRDYDWDYIKVMNDFRFPTVGGVLEAHSVADLSCIGGAQLDYSNFEAQLKVLEKIRSRAEGAPVIDTVFSPLQTIIRTLGDTSVELMRENPDQAREVLRRVTDRLVEYVRRAGEVTDGLYFSVNGASADQHGWGFTSDQFTSWVAPFDREVLEAAQGRVRIMHVHGYDIDESLVADYPVEVMSWSHNQSRPSVSDVAEQGRFVPMGGLDEVGALYWPPSKVRDNVLRTRREAGDRLIVAPGCTVHSDTPPAILHALSAAAREPLGSV